MSTKNIGLVSVGVVALNEAAALSALLEDIVNQDYPHENIEVVLIDSGSSDGTRDIMESFAEKREEFGFSNIAVFDNPSAFRQLGGMSFSATQRAMFSFAWTDTQRLRAISCRAMPLF